MDEIPAEDARVVLDDFAAQRNRLAREIVLVGVDVGDVLAFLIRGDICNGRRFRAAAADVRVPRRHFTGSLRRRLRAPRKILQAAHEIHDVERAVQGLARKAGHGHALVGLHHVAHLDRSLHRRDPALVLPGVHEHVGIATGIHGLQHGAADHAGRHGSGQGRVLGCRLVGGFRAPGEGCQQAQGHRRDCKPQKH